MADRTVHAARAAADLDAEVFFGLPGGGSFDRIVRTIPRRTATPSRHSAQQSESAQGGQSDG